MNYSKILKYDTANGPGIRTTIWFTGCCFQCPECFNYMLRDKNSGQPFTSETKRELFEYLSDPHVTGLSVLGGEPLIQDPELTDLLIEVRQKFPDKTIWMWTGFQLKNLLNEEHYHANINKLQRIACVDYLVDGPYMKDMTEYHTRFRGSSNQIIWHIQPVTSTSEPWKVIQYVASNQSQVFDNHTETQEHLNKEVLVFKVP